MTITELLFGKKEAIMSDEDLEKYTKRRELELSSKTRILRAQTDYDKVKAEHNKLIASNPKLASGGLAGLFTKKATWFVIIGVIILFMIIKAL